MSLLSPLWIGLLGAILLPLAIHLWNKQSGKARLLGTFRFLPEEESSAARNIQLHEVPLMLLRMLLIGMLSLLLADLVIVQQAENPDRITLSISEASESMLEAVEGEWRYKLSETDFRQLGWWNAMKHIDRSYRPELIIAEGTFLKKDFKGERPVLSAEVQFLPMPNAEKSELSLGKWMGENGRGFELRQQLSEKGTQLFQDSASEVDSLFSVELVVDEESGASLKQGMRAAAEQWQVPYREGPLPHTAELLVNGKLQVADLDSTMKERDCELSENEMTGIALSIPCAYNQRPFLSKLKDADTDSLNIPWIADPDLAGWMYYSIAQSWLASHLVSGKEDLLSPEMEGAQRSPFSISVAEAVTDQHSLKNFLFFLLLIGWAVERKWASARGM